MALSFMDRLNARVADSVVGRWFQLEGSGHPKERVGSRFLTELRAGLTTWAAMAYIITVNASIISDSGGTCFCPTGDGCVNDEVYALCVQEVRRDLITSTAATSCLASSLMGIFANLPVGLAPGLGLNAYFAYSVIGFHGTGQTTYQEALAAVFLEGWIFFALSVFGVRQWLARAMPHSLVMAVGAGIGLFIAFIGLSSGGLGVVGGNTTNFVGLGGCKPEDYIEDLPHFCERRVLQNPTMWLGIMCGGFLTMFLMIYRVRGSILIGIFLVAIISWPRGTPVTIFPDTDAGNEAFAFFKQVVTFRPLKKVGFAVDWSSYRTGRVWYALVTFLYVDILDTTGTLYSMAKFAGLRNPVTMDFENSTIAYCVDAIAISAGALMGTSPVTTFVESATGISEGGKTGLAALMTGIMFLVSIFFAPIFASIPSYATGAALVIVGSLMIRNVREVNWDYVGDSVPAFLTLIMIPLTYNIAYGVIAGIGTYILLNMVPFLIRKISQDRIVPPLQDLAEKWKMPPGGFTPMWMRNLLRGNLRFWEDDTHIIAPESTMSMQEMQQTTMNDSHLHRTISMDTSGEDYTSKHHDGIEQVNELGRTVSFDYAGLPKLHASTTSASYPLSQNMPAYTFRRDYSSGTTMTTMVENPGSAGSGVANTTGITPRSSQYPPISDRTSRNQF